MSTEAEREKEVQDAIQKSNEKIKLWDETQAKLSGTSGELNNAASAIQSSIENEKNLVGLLSQIGTQTIRASKAEDWNRFQSALQTSSGQTATIQGILSEAGNLFRNVGTVSAMASGVGSTSVFISYTVIDVFNSPNIPPPARIDPKGFTDTLSNDISVVVAELTSLDNAISDEFSQVTREWNLSSLEIKQNLLLGIRSAIWSKLFEVRFARKSNWLAAPWYVKSSNPRFNQPKFFMIGNSRTSDLTPVQLSEVNRLSTDLEVSFHDLSEYGKLGSTQNDVEDTYRKSIILMKEALLLRKALFKP